MKALTLRFGIAALFVALALPAAAKKKDPARKQNQMECSSGKSVWGQNKHKRFYHLDAYNTPKSKHLARKQRKQWESPRKTISLKYKSPKHRHSSENRSGGFYSFRRHSYSGHIFHRH